MRPLLSGQASLDERLRDRLTIIGPIHPQYDYLESRVSGAELPDPERFFVRRVFAGVKFELSDRLKLNIKPAGYELAEGRNPVRALAEHSRAKETVTGFRLRGQLQF